MKVSETPMHNAGDAAIGGFASDVTELDRTRSELKQHIDANRRTLDQVPSAVALFGQNQELLYYCLLYPSPSPRDLSTSRMPSSA